MDLPQFEVGADGFPVPGKVIKYYREHMVYQDRNGRTRHWTQADLARQLGISVLMVCLMESKNQGLDSIERRRALVSILKIPPAFLGLGSLDQIVALSAGQPVSYPKHVTKHNSIQSYKDAYNTYKQIYRDGLSYKIVNEMEQLAYELADIAKSNPNKESLNLLWQYEILCAKVLSMDLAAWGKAFNHVDNAKDIAVYLDNADLQAASLCYAAIFRFRQGRVRLARMDIDGATNYVRKIAPQTRGIVYSKSACIYAEIATSVSDEVISQNMLDRAEQYINIKDDMAPISFGQEDFYMDKAYVLNTLSKQSRSLECLDDAERYVRTTGKRHTIYLDIKRAQCYIDAKKPDYEQAAYLLRDVINATKDMPIARHIKHVQKIQQKLALSSFGNSPEVIELEVALRILRNFT
jgi:transcriptional regulator with XRE-family HTH domain